MHAASPLAIVFLLGLTHGLIGTCPGWGRPNLLRALFFKDTAVPTKRVWYKDENIGFSKEDWVHTVRSTLRTIVSQQRLVVIMYGCARDCVPLIRGPYLEFVHCRACDCIPLMSGPYLEFVHCHACDSIPLICGPCLEFVHLLCL